MNRVQPDTSLQKPNKYKSYIALLTQMGTSPPTATILHNTIGNIIWSRTDIGEYYGTLQNTFIENQTWIITSQNSNAGVYIAAYNDDNSIYLLTPGDGTLQHASIEIRVYQ